MKIALFGKPFLCLLVFSLAGAHAVGVAEAAPVGDAQVQARRMILGQEHVHSTVAGVTASGPCTTTAACDRNVHEDALEMARRMILGSESAASPKTQHIKLVKER